MSDQLDLSEYGKVLVIDDEESICDVTEKFLQRQNIACLIAMDGHQGLKIFAEHRAEIGAIILDYTMPKMNGEMVFAEIRKIDPDVKVILSSGYSQEDFSEDFMENLSAFIQKPYTLRSLREKLTEVWCPS